MGALPEHATPVALAICGAMVCRYVSDRSEAQSDFDAQLAQKPENRVWQQSKVHRVITACVSVVQTRLTGDILKLQPEAILSAQGPTPFGKMQNLEIFSAHRFLIPRRTVAPTPEAAWCDELRIPYQKKPDKNVCACPMLPGTRCKKWSEATMLKQLLLPLLLCSFVIIWLPDRPTATETWIVSPDGRTASVSGRVRQPIWKRLNPVWWFLNVDEPDPPDWQLPEKPFIIRQLSWYLRNPLHNFGKYVLGVADRNYTVVGAAPLYATSWSDVDPIKTGWKISTIHIDGLRLPFVSYENNSVIWYAGWQWSGVFGLKFRIKNSSIQVW
jgi:hypothetical protein